MRTFGYNRAFQFMALALVFTMVQVYVMAGPIKGHTDPKTTETSASQPKTENSRAATRNILPTPEVAAEKLALRGGSKTVLSRIFSRQQMTERITAENLFVKTSASTTGIFKTPAAQTSATQTNNQDSDEDDHSARKGMWIAVGIIAAVGVIAIIGLRHDRGPCRGNC